jgi:hypothetical protein
MIYNKPDTIYYHAASKMLEFGVKLLSKEKLLSMRRSVSFMRMLTSNELGFSLEGDQASDLIHDLNSFSNRQRPQQQSSGTATKKTGGGGHGHGHGHYSRQNNIVAAIIAKTKFYSGIVGLVIKQTIK